MLWFISDCHIEREDELFLADLTKFIKNNCKPSDIFVFGGDFFHLRIEQIDSFLGEFQSFFETLKSIPCPFYFFDGNHDFYLDRKDQNLFFGFQGKEFLIEGKKVWIEHGDRMIEWDFFFQTYLDLILGGFFYQVVRQNQIFFRKMFEKSLSRPKIQNPQNETAVKNLTRKLVQRKMLEFDVVVSGHNHVLDWYTFDGSIYVNPGFPKKDRKIIGIGQSVEFFSF